MREVVLPWHRLVVRLPRIDGTFCLHVSCKRCTIAVRYRLLIDVPLIDDKQIDAAFDTYTRELRALVVLASVASASLHRESRPDVAKRILSLADGLFGRS